MSFHAALGGAFHACKSVMLGLRGNRSTQLHMQEPTQLLGENVHFWEGDGLATKEICTTFGKRNRLLPKIAQFLG